MKKNLYFFFFSLAVLSAQGSFGQIVGTDCFLQGKWLEVGVNQMGGLGTCSSPATYHTHGCPYSMTPALAPGAQMDASYDWGHDGWTVAVPAGNPSCMGPYTQPGFPQEGWSIQIGGTEYRNGGWGGACTGSFSIPGGYTGYTNTGGTATEYWAGNIGGLNIKQQTRVDTLASWATVTTVIRNTTGAPITNIYYQRTNDPDNPSGWGGGSTTRNRIVHQNEDSRHMVHVSSNSETGVFNATNTYMALTAKDCRARCGVISGLAPGINTLPAMWGVMGVGAGTGSGIVLSILGTNNLNDQGITLIFNIGTLAAGDSTTLTYAYVYDGPGSIDSALPDPRLKITAGIVTTVYPLVPVPNSEYDTFNVCAYPGLMTLPVDIKYGDEMAWANSKWKWSPALGLSATTGAHVTINPVVLPPIFTYTITGTDSLQCLTKTFYLTILTCNGAVANSPCEGDTLWLNAPGDSSAATYKWYGPAPSTTVFSTTQRTFIYPATAAHNGTFSVIKTVAGIPDTSIVIVTIRHKPTVWVSSNSPLCLGGGNTLLLTSVVDSPGMTYSWTAVPPAFTSTVASPTIPGFGASDTGTYRLIVRSVFGCKDTGFVHVTIAPVPPAPVMVPNGPYCQFQTFVPFAAVPSSVVPGGTVLWYASATGGVGAVTAPTVNTSVPGVSTFYFSQIIGSCEGPRDSIKVIVNPVPSPIVGALGVCQYFTTSLSTTSTGGTWSSSNPAVASINSATGVVSGLTPGTATISYTLSTGCRATAVLTVHPKPAPPTIPTVRHCQHTVATPLPSTIGTNLTWYGLGVTAGTPIAPTPNTDTLPGYYNYYVTQTSAFGCVSDSAMFPVRIVAEPAAPMTLDTTYCQKDQVPALTAIGSSLLWYTSATSTPGVATPPIPATDNPGVTGYYVTQTVDGCESPRAVLNVTILYKPDFIITPDKTWVCQFDSTGMHYDGPVLINPGYVWTLPIGASFVNGTTSTDPAVVIRFDTARGIHEVTLTASDYNGKCATTMPVRIKVVPAPATNPHIKTNICLGDTITLALSDRTMNSDKFYWFIDGTPLGSSPYIDMISSSSNSGGPFIIKWKDTGSHIIRVQGLSIEGCRSETTSDTVKIHSLPDPRFTFSTPKKFCIEDSVLFSANIKNYSYSYQWEPEHSFSNENKPEIWGRVEQLRSVVKLTVRDPFGCWSSYTKQINPDECCTVAFPSAFTPNGDGKNDMFRPIFAGYRRFHIFRVSNRWGQTIFECANTNPSWDGTYNGQQQDMGTYYYYIKYDCGGKTLEVKGDITLIR